MTSYMTRALQEEAAERKAKSALVMGRILELEGQLQEQIARGDFLQDKVSTSVERLAKAQFDRLQLFAPLDIIESYALALAAVQGILREKL